MNTAGIDDKRIDDITKNWQQGDVHIGVCDFLYACPASGSVMKDAEGPYLCEEVEGFCVVSQTCDVVRNCRDRPLIEVAAIVQINNEALYNSIKKGERPQFAYIPGLESYKYVADLEQVMCYEKSILLEWDQVRGCRSDRDIRKFAQALARKKTRFAFPDDFNQSLKKILDQVKKKHGNNTPFGQALNALYEIKVIATPNWNAEKVDVTFYFIKETSDQQIDGMTWDKFLEFCLKLVPNTDKFTFDGLVTSMEDLTAREYEDCDRLDLENLSSDES